MSLSVPGLGGEPVSLLSSFSLFGGNDGLASSEVVVLLLEGVLQLLLLVLLGLGKDVRRLMKQEILDIFIAFIPAR